MRDSQNHENEMDIESESYSHFSIDAEWSSVRLDVVVTQGFEALPSRSFAAKLIAQGWVKVNGKIVKASYKCNSGDIITLDTHLFKERSINPQAEKIPLDVIFEDDHLIVLNKPAGMVVHPGAGNPSGTLVNAILGHCGNTLPSLGSEVRAGIVHRLDRDTSGVMVVAKSQLALTELSRQFATHEQERWYLAIVLGHTALDSGKIETWHGRDKNHRIRFAVQEEGDGKLARMFYNTIERFQHNKVSLVRCELYTGRTHQIRVQMKHIGHALLGDPLYKCDYAQLKLNKALWSKLEPMLTRQMLHAQHLQFTHPHTGEVLCFETDPPSDFVQVAQLLRS